MKEQLMQHNFFKVSPIEKIISILSYITMGIIGLVWLLIAHFSKKKLRYFLMFNIVQSMIIAIFLAILKLTLNIIFSILSIVPFINILAAKLNYIISVKILIFPILNLSFNVIEIILYILLIYIIMGVLTSRIFYIPYLTSLISKLLKTYN